MKIPRYAVAIVVIAALLIGWLIGATIAKRTASKPVETNASAAAISGDVPLADDAGGTLLGVRNVRLQDGPAFRVYIRWIRGKMVRTHADRTPSLDDLDSFVFMVEKGFIRANLGDVEKFLNTTVAPRSPLKNMVVSGHGNEIRIAGSLNKWKMTLPVEVDGTFSAAPDGRVHLHVNRIHVLKVGVKWMMGGLNVGMNDIVGTTPLGGVEVKGEDVYVDTGQLLPPPRIRGKLTSLSIQAPDVVAIYGDASNDEAQLARWHNGLGLRGGEVGFGRLIMKNADLMLIDVKDEDWFDLDLAKYPEQLVRGYCRMTSKGGFEMFMPGADAQMPAEATSMEILKNRDRAIPIAPPAKK